MMVQQFFGDVTQYKERPPFRLISNFKKEHSDLLNNDMDYGKLRFFFC